MSRFDGAIEGWLGPCESMPSDRRVVYVSSTFVDLEKHRAVLKHALEQAGYEVESMERYPAFDRRPLDKCLADVASCDVYVLLVARRYGHVPIVSGEAPRSITEREYDCATASGKPRFVFFVDPDHPWPAEWTDAPRSAAGRRLAAFRKRLAKAHGQGRFTNPDSLAVEVLATLATLQRQHEPAGYAWLKPWNFAAYMEEKREAFEGRDWVFSEIAAWLAEGHPRALLVEADYGVGKSAIVAELIRRNPNGVIAAWHFCQHDEDKTLLAGAFVLGLAAQLAAAFPAYRAVVDAEPTLQDLLARASAAPGSALEGAVLGPLAQLPAPEVSRLIVIDGLDEALELDIETARNGTIVSVLASKAGRFPRWLRLLATARPTPAVRDPLHAFGIKVLDAEGAANQRDMHRYVLGRAALEPLRSQLLKSGESAQALAELLIAQSHGKFLYTAMAVRGIENGRIQVAELAALSPGMSSFYQDAFERCYERAGPGYELARAVLGLLATAREPVSPTTLAGVLASDVDQVSAVRIALRDFLRDRAGKLTFGHFSLAQWLSRERTEGIERGGDFSVDLKATHERWRTWALKQVRAGQACASPYLLRHLAAHLGDSNERRDVFETLMLDNADWMSARLRASGIEALMVDVEHLAGLPEHESLDRALRNAAHVLRKYPDQLPAQLLGRIGRGLGPGRRLGALADSVRGRLSAPWASTHEARLLLPDTRSLRLTDVRNVLPGSASALALLADGRLVSGGAGGKVRVWASAGLSEPTVFEGHGTWVHALAVLRNGLVASGADDGKVRVWDAGRSADPVVFQTHSSPISALISLADGRIASGASDGTVSIWDPQGLRETTTFEGPAQVVRVLAELPDGRIVSGGADGDLRVWDPASAAGSIVFEGHASVVQALVVLQDGNVVSGSYDHTVTMWDPARPTERVVFEGHTDNVQGLAVLEDGRVVSASDDCTLRIWDTRQRTGPLVLEGHTGGIMAVTILSDGRIASGGRDHSVRVWDWRHSRDSLVFTGHSAWVRSLVALPDGRLASAADDETTRVWDPQRPATAEAVEGHAYSVNALAVLPDGRVASASDDRTVRLWDPRRAAHSLVLDRRGDYRVSALAVLTDGRIAAAGGYTVRVCDPQGFASPVIFEGHTDGVNTLAALPDGRVASGGFDSTVRLWDPRLVVAPAVLEGHGKWVNKLAALSDGRLVSCGLDGTVRVWDPRSGRELQVFEGHEGAVYALAVLPDGRIASGGLDRTVRVWNLQRPSEVAVLNGHSDSIRAFAVLSNGRFASASSDGTVRIWNQAQTAVELVLDAHPGGVQTLAVLPDGRVASGGNDGTVRIWSASGKRHEASMFVADEQVNCLAVASGQLVAGCNDGTVHFLCEYSLDGRPTCGEPTSS